MKKGDKVRFLSEVGGGYGSEFLGSLRIGIPGVLRGPGNYGYGGNA